MDSRTIDLFRECLSFLAPPPDILVSQWAEENRVLSRESSAEPGKWRNDRAPYQVEIMDAVNDPEIEKIAVMSCSQVGKNEIINNIIGYLIDIDPCPILLIEPTLELAEDYSKRRIAPLIQDTKVLKKKVANTKSRDTNNTILSKNYPGGSLVLVGANSPRGLASKPIRVVIADEIDGFPVSAGTEGDPLELVEKRTITYINRKIIHVSTPTIEGISRIKGEFEKGTQEKWQKECPHCGEYVYINLRGIRFEYSKDEKGNYSVWDITFQCPACLEEFDEFTWKNSDGKWVAENPGAKKMRSFHLNAFVSPWWFWEDIIKLWLKVKKDPEQFKVFTNTVLGETWEDRGDIEDEDVLLKRREHYEAELPEGVLVLTCGVDTQDDRLEYEVVGWGKFQESWGIEKGVIMGIPDDESTWQALDDKVDKVWRFANGIGLTVSITLIDSGGHYTKEVYRYCKRNESRRIFPIKGQGGPSVSFPGPPSRKNEARVALFTLGVDSGKAQIMSRLKITEYGPKYCHFPSNEDRGYDRKYFQGLLSERMVPKRKNGQTVMAWEKVRTNVGNEPLDCRNYALAGIHLLKPNMDLIEKRLKSIENPSGNQLINTSKPRKRKRGVVNKGIEY